MHSYQKLFLKIFPVAMISMVCAMAATAATTTTTDSTHQNMVTHKNKMAKANSHADYFISVALAPNNTESYSHSGENPALCYGFHISGSDVPVPVQQPATVPYSGCYNMWIHASYLNANWNSAGNLTANLIVYGTVSGRVTPLGNFNVNFGSCNAGGACAASLTQCPSTTTPQGMLLSAGDIVGNPPPQVTTAGAGNGVLLQNGSITMQYCGSASKPIGPYGACSPC